VMTVKKESNASIKEYIVRWQWLSQKKSSPFFLLQKWEQNTLAYISDKD
jgi:hypothetical protein